MLNLTNSDIRKLQKQFKKKIFHILYIRILKKKFFIELYQ